MASTYKGAHAYEGPKHATYNSEREVEFQRLARSFNRDFLASPGFHRAD